jgi:hypothetical protein
MQGEKQNDPFRFRGAGAVTKNQNSTGKIALGKQKINAQGRECIAFISQEILETARKMVGMAMAGTWGAGGDACSTWDKGRVTILCSSAAVRRSSSSAIFRPELSACRCFSTSLGVCSLLCRLA